jgi:two-component system OmpR family sensor kinase/two-component system sensor histidine kinase BaeS
LLLGFVLVAVIAVGVVAVLANRTTARQFEIYVSQGRQMRAQQLAPALAAYYTGIGSWAGATEWLVDLDRVPPGNRGQGQGRGQGRGSPTDRLILADGDGQVVADTEGTLVGEHLSDAELALGTPIEVAGERVGTLLIPAAASVHESLDANFLREVNRSLLWAGLVAGTVALAIGLLLARQLTAPLRDLTQAAHRLADGDVPQVQVRSKDEVGELGQAFNQMAQSLARQDALRRNLMADIAHELRTPLTVIRSDLEALLDGVYEPTPEALASLQEETLLVSRLVDDLRALAQAEAGQLRLERQPTDLSELLHGVVGSFDLQAESQGQTLTLDLPPALPPVDIDPHRVRQVVANLISNALRHAVDTPGDMGGGRVIVSAVQQSEVVQVSVSDNGPGIAPEALPRIFDRFWQGDRARAGSSGLGLAIARELVRAHGGQIWAESASGQGATFRFTLPTLRGNSDRTAG